MNLNHIEIRANPNTPYESSKLNLDVVYNLILLLDTGLTGALPIKVIPIHRPHPGFPLTLLK
ncbi:hypothetical protein [Rubripirellula lacrimiformis]|nr:hypothetical protein [Rubripirellula lacrimiformis]